MLDHDGVVDILTLIAASDDRRAATEADVNMWLLVLTEGGVTSKEDACQAVIKHLATSEAWVKPVHVIQGVRAIRAARLESCPPLGQLMADIDGADPNWAEIVKARREAIATGQPALRAVSS